jgi:hypothetical protein
MWLLSLLLQKEHSGASEREERTESPAGRGAGWQTREDAELLIFSLAKEQAGSATMPADAARE